MIKNRTYFTQFPSWITTYPKLSHFQFRLYTLLEHYRFINVHPTSEELAEHLDFSKKNPKAFRDYLRHELNKFKDIFPEEYLKIIFKKRGIGKAHFILIKFNYLNTELRITNEVETEIGLQDRETIRHFIKNSRCFSNYELNEILSIKSDFENLIKALLYVDTKKNVNEPLRYLRSCFKNGVFKYDKEKFNLELLEAKNLDDKNRIKKLAKIDSMLLYQITLQNKELLKHLKPEHLQFSGITTKESFLITRALYKTKKANVKNWLDKLKIPYQILLR